MQNLAVRTAFNPVPGAGGRSEIAACQLSLLETGSLACYWNPVVSAVALQDPNIPLVFSRHRVNILTHFVVSLIPQHGPDHTNHVSSKSTNCLVVGLALCTFSVVVSL